MTTRLVAFYGQHEHRRLTLAAAQLELLDGACGDGAPRSPRRSSPSGTRGSGRSPPRSTGCGSSPAPGSASSTCCDFELAEIEEADPSEAEEAELTTRRDRLRHVEALRSAALVAAEAFSPEEGPGVAGLLAHGGSGLDGIAGVDPELDAADRAVAGTGDRGSRPRGGAARTYGEGLEHEPGGLELIEERLTAWDRLKRKHGGTLAAVLEHAERCRARRAELDGAEVALEAATAELHEQQEALEAQALALRATRLAAAPGLAEAVRARLAALAMETAIFEIAVEPREVTGPTGADAVEFRIAANPGVPAGPLREIASGGELSRVMLSLLGVANDGSEATLVFDEIDAGIGGQTARAVGEQLRGARRGASAALHHPPAADRVARGSTLLDRKGRERRAGPHDGPHAAEARGRRRAGADARRGGGRRRRPPPRQEAASRRPDRGLPGQAFPLRRRRRARRR